MVAQTTGTLLRKLGPERHQNSVIVGRRGHVRSDGARPAGLRCAPQFGGNPGRAAPISLAHDPVRLRRS
jgi:hypothetical protein